LIDNAIQAYLRAVTARVRDTEHIGPFLATFSRSSTNPFLNYAIPDENAAPTPGDVAALVSAYRSRGLTPRLEYIPGIAPLVEDALLAQGFSVEGRLPLMICPPGAVRDLPVPPCIEIVAPVSNDDLRAMLSAQNEAYGEGAPSEQDVAQQRAFLADGGIALLARDDAAGEPAGGGICSVPIDGVTELAGVGVREPFRRRGIAGALTARLAQEAFARGITTVFLMAAHEAEARIYARVGFSRIGEVLHISRPTGD
jgi:GNAT superfamily N-acetyltransferase